MRRKESKGKKRRYQVMNIERKGKKNWKQKTEEMGNLLNYREIHFLTHNKIKILDWKIDSL